MDEGKKIVRLCRIYLTCQGGVGKASKACCSGYNKRVNQSEITVTVKASKACFSLSFQ